MELKLDQRAYRIQDLENALHKHTQNLSAVRVCVIVLNVYINFSCASMVVYQLYHTGRRGK